MSTTITVIERATVARINQEHQLCQRAYGDALAHAIEAGRLLADVKGQLRHGEFGTWVKEHFEGSDRTARVYMQLAAAPEVAERQDSADLSIEGALKQIATPKPKRATASDVGSFLQGLGGPAPSELPERVDEARDRLQGEQPAQLWTDQEARKYTRATALLDEALSSVRTARANERLSRYALSEIIRQASVQIQSAAPLLDELAFSFER